MACVPPRDLPDRGYGEVSHRSRGARRRRATRRRTKSPISRWRSTCPSSTWMRPATGTSGYCPVSAISARTWPPCLGKQAVIRRVPIPVPNARWCGTPSTDHALPRVADHAGVEVSYGRIRDGVGSKDRVVAWLREHAIAAEEWMPGVLTGLPIHPESLTVRIVENATDEQRGWVVEAVRVINASLPHEWKLSISDRPVPLTAIRSMSSVANGEVHVRFDSGHNHHYSLAIDNRELIGGDGYDELQYLALWPRCPCLWPGARPQTKRRGHPRP